MAHPDRFLLAGVMGWGRSCIRALRCCGRLKWRNPASTRVLSEEIATVPMKTHEAADKQQLLRY